MSDVAATPVDPSTRRSEAEVFDDLRTLCTSPGYVHAIAYLCWRDNIIPIGEELRAEDLAKLSSPVRLIRTEISTLIGLLASAPIDFNLPSPDQLQRYVEKSDRLLAELHDALNGEIVKHFDFSRFGEPGFNPLTSGAAMREAIFYGAESAYTFQYRDLFAPKYAADDDWFKRHKGFSISVGVRIASALEKLLSDRATETLNCLRDKHPDTWSFLPAFAFRADDLVAGGAGDADEVAAFLKAFAVDASRRNATFTALQAFNETNACPLIATSDGAYVLFQTYTLLESMYESPFFWMLLDKAYQSTALEHRGEFTEQFCAARLRHVFGGSHVFENVELVKGKEKVGEIDTLVLFGQRAVIVQAKSKRLTIEARKGNDLQLRADFRNSVQDAYDQGEACAARLLAGDVKLVTKAGAEVSAGKIVGIYLMCVVSDHYPALSSQAREFLKYKSSGQIFPPFVCDVFLIDVLAEFLTSPLRFLSYLDRRVNYESRLLSSHELVILGYHLKQNLWLTGNVDLVYLQDDLATDLDVAMAVRRLGAPGVGTPPGILTRLGATSVGRLIADLESREEPAAVDIGFVLLALGEEAVGNISKAVDRIVAELNSDGKRHDLTVPISESKTGLTVHATMAPGEPAAAKLKEHCLLRKYRAKADSWHGLCVSADGSVRFGGTFRFPWTFDREMESRTKDLALPVPFEAALAGKKPKIGRNEKCPCGSGLKFKKCHGR